MTLLTLGSRHLKTHNFHACQFCFQKFGDSATQMRHFCFKACQNISCRRKVAVAPRPTAKCVCITTAEEQWAQLFLLQYPGRELPPNSIFDSDAYTAIPDAIGISDGTSSFITATIDDLSFQHHRSDQGDSSSSEATQSTSQDHDYLLAEIETLRQQLRQQQVHQRSPREDNLETTLGLVWQAFCRTGSAERCQDSMLWRLVKRDAPNVLQAPQPWRPRGSQYSGSVQADLVQAYNNEIDWQQWLQESGEMMDTASAYTSIATEVM